MKIKLFIFVFKIFIGEYKKDELLEVVRSGNEDKLMFFLIFFNVNCYVSDGRKVGIYLLKILVYVFFIFFGLYLIIIFR